MSEDVLTVVAVGLLVVWCLWKHPTATTGIGLVVLVGLVCFGAAHAKTPMHGGTAVCGETHVCSGAAHAEANARRDNRRRHRQDHHRRRYQRE
jgi:hypothetical protein